MGLGVKRILLRRHAHTVFSRLGFYLPEDLCITLGIFAAILTYDGPYVQFF